MSADNGAVRGKKKQVISTVEMHTGGEPLRIIVAGELTCS